MLLYNIYSVHVTLQSVYTLPPYGYVTLQSVYTLPSYGYICNTAVCIYFTLLWICNTAVCIYFTLLWICNTAFLYNIYIVLYPPNYGYVTLHSLPYSYARTPNKQLEFSCTHPLSSYLGWILPMEVTSRHSCISFSKYHL